MLKEEHVEAIKPDEVRPPQRAEAESLIANSPLVVIGNKFIQVIGVTGGSMDVGMFNPPVHVDGFKLSLNGMEPIMLVGRAGLLKTMLAKMIKYIDFIQPEGETNDTSLSENISLGADIHQEHP